MRPLASLSPASLSLVVLAMVLLALAGGPARAQTVTRISDFGPELGNARILGTDGGSAYFSLEPGEGAPQLWRTG